MWGAVSGLFLRLFDWNRSVIYEYEEKTAYLKNGWPVIHISITVHNRSDAPIYAYSFDVIGEHMLNIGEGLPDNHKFGAGQIRETSFSISERSIAGGTNSSFDFILYPNWQKWASGLDSEHPQLGLSGQSAGIVATFQTCLRLRSKSRRRIPNVTTRTIKITNAAAIENARIAHSIHGDMALTHWKKPSIKPSPRQK